MPRDRPEWLSIMAMGVVGLGALSIYCAPGFMAFDSVEQLAQARAGTLTDAHPPVMSAMWAVLDRIVPGPALMLYVQASLFLAGCYGLLRRRCTPPVAAALATALLLFPPTLTMMAVIVKDNLMCGGLLVGCVGILSARPWARVVGLLAFLLATSVRDNAFAAVVPLLVLLSPWPARGGRVARALVGFGVSILLVVAALGANRALTDVKTYPFYYSVAPMDYVGTLRFAEPLSDAEVRELFAGVPIAVPADIQAWAVERYDAHRWWGEYIYGDRRLIDPPTSAPVRHAMMAAWLRLMRELPVAYLLNRADMFRELIGVTDVKWTPVYAVPHERSMYKGNGTVAPRRNFVQRRLSQRFTDWSKTSILFRPYLYLVMLVALFIVLRRDLLVVALLGSAVSHLALLFFVSPAPDIRYAHWLMVTTGIAFAIRLFGQHSRSVPRGLARAPLTG